MYVALFIPAFLLFAGNPPPLPKSPANTLFPIAGVARRIQNLQGPIAPVDTQPAALKKRLAAFRQVVSQYVVRQIETYPSISESSLQGQLAKAFGTETDATVPRVFAQPWGPSMQNRLFVISYGWFGFYFTNGSQTVLESYIWTAAAGVHRGAGTVPSAFNGLRTQTEEICWFPDPSTYWLLISGTVYGASGRVLGGGASVIEIGPAETRIIWSAPPKIGNVVAYTPPMSNRWEIDYTVVGKLYKGLPNPRLLDIFQIDFLQRTFRRIVHQPLP